MTFRDSAEREHDEVSVVAFPGALDGSVDPELLIRKALEDVRIFIRQYVYFSAHYMEIAVALWVAHTWFIDSWESTPYLAVISGEKRSGKSRLLEVIELLVARPWRLVTPTPAVLFRKIEQDQPTLLLDEFDTISNPRNSGYEPVRAILNGGNRRGTVVSRVVGDGASMVVKDFKVFCPKAIAGIGQLPDTVADRAITIAMQRRPLNHSVGTFRHSRASAESEPIRNAFAQLAQTLNFSEQEPQMPGGLTDRSQDGWEPLLILAEAAGGNWPSQAREAAVRLSGDDDQVNESLNAALLRDVAELFEQTKLDRLCSKSIVEGLKAMDDRPWSDPFPNRLSPHSLASRLRAYGVTPQSIRIGETTCKGYYRSDFEQAWNSYVPKTSHGEPSSRAVVPPFSPSEEEPIGPEGGFNEVRNTVKAAVVNQLRRHFRRQKRTS